jgi:hypothetical protein
MDAMKQLPVDFPAVGLALKILDINDVQLVIIAIAEVLPDGLILSTCIEFATSFFLKYETFEAVQNKFVY